MNAEILLAQFSDEAVALGLDHRADDARAGVFAGDAHVVFQSRPQEAIEVFRHVGGLQVARIVGESDVRLARGGPVDKIFRRSLFGVLGKRREMR
jgi:hypothetical protein